MGPIGKDPAFLFGKARFQAGATQLEATPGIPAVDSPQRIEDDGRQSEEGADTTAEQVAVNPVEVGSIRRLEGAGGFGSQLDDNRGSSLPLSGCRHGIIGQDIERIGNGLGLGNVHDKVCDLLLYRCKILFLGEVRYI